MGVEFYVTGIIFVVILIISILNYSVQFGLWIITNFNINIRYCLQVWLTQRQWNIQEQQGLLHQQGLRRSSQYVCHCWSAQSELQKNFLGKINYETEDRVAAEQERFTIMWKQDYSEQRKLNLGGPSNYLQLQWRRFGLSGREFISFVFDFWSFVFFFGF